MKLEWYVYYHNINSQRIETYNIFDHRTFNKYVNQHLEECQTKEEFDNALESELRYYFWCKAEWEIIVSPWCGDRDTKEVKIDVYDQVMLNFDLFVDYVWKNKTK